MQDSNRKASKMKGIEEAARAIAPRRWAVMDGYLRQAIAKYKGQNATYDPDAFNDGESIGQARAAIRAYLSAQDPKATVAELLKEMGR